MSTPTLDRSVEDFDDEFDRIVDQLRASRRTRPSRAVADREAIDQSAGIYRHRTTERRD